MGWKEVGKSGESRQSGAAMAGELYLLFEEAEACVTTLEIRELPNRHGELSATALAKETVREQILYDGKGQVTLLYKQKEKAYPLFCGIVTKLEASFTGEMCMIEVEAKTASYQMDVHKCNASYQDIAMTFHQLIQKLMGDFAGGEALIAVPDRPMGGIAMQYRETYWEFIKRMASGQGAFVYAVSAVRTPHLQIGLSGQRESVDWDDLPYFLERSSGVPGVQGLTKGQLSYRVETYDILKLGAGVLFHNRELFVGGIRRKMQKGLLCNEYTLYFREGLQPGRYENPLLMGISVNASVEGVKRDRIRVRMETDALHSYQSQYFFPYSTVAASPDGSGWYCMPKAGDQVRIFFPDSDERNGYAISNIQGESSPKAGSPMSSPEIKEIAPPDGNAVRFTGNGMQLSAGDGAGTVVVSNDGTAQISSGMNVIIGAASAISIETEGALELSAGEEVLLSGNGANISMKSDTVEIHATLVVANAQGGVYGV